MPDDATKKPPGVFNLNPGDRCRDWRTLDPPTLRGQGEELQTHREKIAEILAEDDGRDLHVLIVGTQVIRFFSDPEQAVSYPHLAFKDRQILIKKVAAWEPIRSLGGATSPRDSRPQSRRSPVM